MVVMTTGRGQPNACTVCLPVLGLCDLTFNQLWLENTKTIKKLYFLIMQRFFLVIMLYTVQYVSYLHRASIVLIVASNLYML